MEFAIRSCLMISLMITVSACIITTSVNPVYDDDALVFDPGLLGTWESADKNDDEVLQFQPGNNNSYHLYSPDGEASGFMIIHLADIGEHRYFDACVGKSLETDPTPDDHTSEHIFFRFDRDGDELRFALLNDTWLKENLENGSLQLPYELVERTKGEEEDKRVRITATTEELQQFLIQHQDNPNLFIYEGDGAWFNRVKSGFITRRNKPVTR